MISTPADLLLSAESDKVEEVKTAAGVPAEVWNFFYAPLLTAFARHVQRLPLSRETFSGEKGALEFGLTTAMIALRVAGAQMFYPDALSEERRILEPQCRFAAFAATLSTVVAMVAQNTCVMSSLTDEYHPLVCPVPLEKWLALNPAATLQWRAADVRLSAAECAAIAARFIPTGMLVNFDIRVALMIFNSIAPQSTANGIESTLSRVVRQSVAEVLKYQLKEDQKRYRAAEPTTLAQATLSSIADAITAGSASAPQTSAAAAANEPSAATHQVASASPVATSPEPSLEAAQAILEKAHGALQDWFKALRTHEKFPSFQEKIKATDVGIEIPVSLLGIFGVSGPMVRDMLSKAGLVIDRTANSQGIILHPALKPFFFAPTP